MKIKIAKYMADFFVEHGVTDMFTITGGAAMHLNDAFGHKEGLHCTYNHHEQACAIAAEAYTRLTRKIAPICVTGGPGGTNAITGVFGAWADSIPMFVISGQAKRETTVWSTDVPVRQLGDQEVEIVKCVAPMTKYAKMITEPSEIKYHLEKAWYLCQNGRPGPVWLDMPLDVQASMVELDDLKGFDVEEYAKENAEEFANEHPVYDEKTTEIILEKVKNAKRPVILAGTGVRLSGGEKEFIECIEKLNIPVVTAWNAHDILWDEHPLYCGRPGTVGTRGGNFIVQNSDLLIVLGSRLNIRMSSYNYKDFAKDAFKIFVDIDRNEMNKPTIVPDMPVHADVKEFMKSIAESDYVAQPKHEEWLKWSREINAKYPATLPSYYENKEKLNPYVFMTKLFQELEENDKVICGNGGACVITFQAAEIKKGQRLFTNSGCAAMGYGFPAAIGGCVAEKGKRVVCIDGDGSFQMNLQELQTVVYNNMNMKLMLLNNNGYHSIRQTQKNLFQPPLVGVCDGNGLSFPDCEKLAYAYGIPYVRIDSQDGIEEKIQSVLNSEGPCFCEVVVDENQNFEPKLSSKVLPDGKIVSPQIDDMFPFLPKEEYEVNKASCR